MINNPPKLNELALFSGAGGGILGGMLSGFRTVCAVEITGYARDVLLARQNDGILEPFPIWDDVRSFDGRPWNGLVDVVSGGFPCQDISIARAMLGRKGLDGDRSGLWREMLRIIAEVRPPHVFGENSPALRQLGLHKIVDELASIGYASRWITLGADTVGLHHRRKRLWFYASDTFSKRLEGQLWHSAGEEGRQDKTGSPAHASLRSCAQCGHIHDTPPKECPACQSSGSGGGYGYGSKLLPSIPGMGHGMADWLDRIETIGNGQVPAVASLAWEILRLKQNH